MKLTKEYVYKLLCSGPITDKTILDVAREHNVSTITIRRQLDREGTSWSDIYRQVFIDRTTRMVRSGATVEEISENLGYTERDSFYRQFKVAFGFNWSAWSEKRRRRL